MTDANSDCDCESCFLLDCESGGVELLRVGPVRERLLTFEEKVASVCARKPKSLQWSRTKTDGPLDEKRDLLLLLLLLLRGLRCYLQVKALIHININDDETQK